MDHGLTMGFCLFGWLVVWLVDWLDKAVFGVVFFPVLEQQSLDFEVLYCPNPQLNVVMRLTSSLMFLSDFTRQITDIKVANDLLGYILAQS